MSNLKAMYPNWMSDNGIFTDLALYVSELPWSNDMALAGRLDLEYFGNVSGNKEISPLLEGLSDKMPLNTQKREKLAKMLWNLFNHEWTKLWAVYLAEYNPISNYDMVETEKINNDIVEDSGTKSIGEVKTNGTNSSDRYGFNSSSASNVDKETITNTTTTKNDTDVDRKVDNDTTRELKRTGNIGVTTSQQMIQSEIELWQWNYFKSVFKNIDEIVVCNFWHC